METDKVVAIGLLTRSNLQMLGSSLKHVIPVSDDDRFEDILKALDESDMSRGER